MRLIAAILCMIIPVQAVALSCVPPSVQASFGYAQKAEQLYVVVNGTIRFDESKLPKEANNPNSAPELTRIPAQISGHSLSKGGFVTMFQRDVTLDVRCFGPWCGSIKSGAEILAFLERTDAGYALSVDPCYAYVLDKPTAKMLDEATACMNGAACR